MTQFGPLELKIGSLESENYDRLPRIRENYHRVPRIRKNRVPRIREIGSLQVHTRYLTFSLKKICTNVLTIELTHNAAFNENFIIALITLLHHSGTQTGKALNHTADVLLKIGNRPTARDVVLLITDGASQDDITIPSRRVRDTGALASGSLS